MKTTLLTILTLCLSAFAFSQNNISFNFNHMLNDEAFAFDQATAVDGGYELKLERLEYYLSEVEITHDGGMVTAIEDLYLLVQPGVESVYDLGTWNVNSIESVQFGFGVDASVNTADPAQWLSDHPLSFQNPSMHWGWASGYRFLAVEGTAGADFINVFEIHALGNNNYGLVTLAFDDLTAIDDNITIAIDADYAKIFNGVDIELGDIVHSTSLPKAINSLNNCKTLVFTPGDISIGVDELNLESQVQISPNPIADNILIVTLADWSKENITLNIFDTLGKLVQSDRVRGSRVSMDVSELQKGIYFAQLQDTKGNIVTKRFIK